MPGSTASTFTGVGTIELLMRVLFKSRCRLSTFARSFAAQRFYWTDVASTVTHELFPMPLPYPEVFAKKEEEGPVVNQSLKKMVVMMIIVLNFLHLGRAKTIAQTLKSKQRLTRQQWQSVKRLEAYVEAWTEVSPIGPEQMGRTAGKVESLEEVLRGLESRALDLIRKNDSYFPDKKQEDLAGDPGLRSSVPIGIPLQGSMSTFKTIESSRLKFVGTPSFDPTPYLDPVSKQIYLDPLGTRDEIQENTPKPPTMRIHCSKKEKIKLLELLDSSDRLSLHLPEEVVPVYGNGLFCVAKDLQRDRLILDARGANILERPPNRWIKALAGGDLLTSAVLEDHELLVSSGNDLRDFYYFFKASDSRSRRNVLVSPFHPKQLCHLGAFRQRLLKSKVIYGALATLAMGDTQAVELAESCHLGLSLQRGIVNRNNLLSLTRPYPRGDTAIGLVIDDFVAISKVPKTAEGASRGAKKAEEMQEGYKTVGLMPNESKSFRDEEKVSFWGVDLDGRIGFVRGSMKRALPLAGLILKMLQVGYATADLLQIISGCLISLFLYRRRFLSLMDSLFQSYRGLGGRQIVALTGRLVSDLLSMLILLPLAATNLRAAPAEFIYASDASGWGEACVRTRIPRALGKELTRHVLRKSIWVRLLAPSAAWERMHGVLEAEGEVPSGVEAYHCNPLWEVLARSLRYEKVFAKQKTGDRHINVGEVRAALKSERIAATRNPGSRQLIAMDSQVGLGSLIKGRSASPAINNELVRSIPHLVALDVFPDYIYYQTKINPGDDPTRGAPIRLPDLEKPHWWADASKGDFRTFDLWLKQHGLDEDSVSGLPPLSELGYIEEEEEIHSFTEGILPEPSPVFQAGGPSMQSEESKVNDSHSLQDLLYHDSPEAGEGAEESCASPHVLDRWCGEYDCPQTPPLVSIGKGLTNFGTEDEPKLSDEAQKLLSQFSKDKFVLPAGMSWPPTKPGWLDLFSGERRVAAEAAKAGKWSLCFDLEHGADEDLSQPWLRRKLEAMVVAGCFEVVGGGPVCASFSTAVTPAVRNSQHPYGKPDISENMKKKVAEGNESAIWVFSLLRKALQKGVIVWMENPCSSWMFKLPEWERLMKDYPSLGYWVVDYCRYKMPWRKRTRFASNTKLAGFKTLCSRDHPHLLLGGRSKKDKKCWTRVAQAYPAGVCRGLVRGLKLAVDQAEDVFFDPGECAKAGGGRIGEASNPGPRRRRFRERTGLLSAVPLVEAKTLGIQSKTWGYFIEWLRSHLSPAAMESAFSHPLLFAPVLEEYGNHMYETGQSLYLYRHLVVYAQQHFWQMKPYMNPAWSMISRWEKLEPTKHRVPLPEAVFRAMMSTSLVWGWYHFAAILGIGFLGITRPSEALNAERKDLILPADRLEPASKIAYLRIDKSKTSGRGNARVQHASFSDEVFIQFLQNLLQRHRGTEKINGISASAFRRRWDSILGALLVPKSCQLTPGGIRGGGCVSAFQRGCDVSTLLWKMRLKQVTTLENYLQEVTASTLVATLPTSSRLKIQRASACFETLLRTHSRHTLLTEGY